MRKSQLEMTGPVATLSKEQFEALAVLEKTWASSCEELRCPPDEEILGLIRAHGLAASEYAVRRLGRKLHSARLAGEATMTAENARKYCLAVAKNSTSGEFPDRQAPGRQT